MNLDTLRKRLTIEEGDRLTAYLDTRGILTVGRGHNCIAKPVWGVTKPGDRITQAMDDQLFAEDVAEACKQLDARLPWWKSLDSDRQNVMIDMAFNMGIETLLTFHTTLSYVKNGMWEEAAEGMKNSRWHKQVGNRAVFLENAMREGQYV